MTQPPFHTITNKDIWEKLVSVEQSVNAVHSDLRSQRERSDGHEERLKAYGERIRTLDLKVYGVLAGLAGGYAYLIWGG